MCKNSRRCGFTLVELLVVVAIIALLIGILLPALGRAREMARATRCQANLHGIGQAIKAYMLEHHDYYPPMAIVPTVESAIHPQKPRPAMCDILSPHTGGQKQVLHCPSDHFIDPESKFAGSNYLIEGNPDAGSPPAVAETWFAWQGSSYEPLPGLSIVDETGRWKLSQESRDNLTLNEVFGNPSSIVIMYDYERFHRRSSTGSFAGRTLLYADFHVAEGK